MLTITTLISRFGLRQSSCLILSLLLLGPATPRPAMLTAGLKEPHRRALSTTSARRHLEAAQVSVSVQDVNPDDAQDRGSCLTIAVGSSAAAQCGDLRITHALPAVRTFGTVRAPTLVYNSEFASPNPVIAANVTLPLTVSPPDRVEATLFINGQSRAHGVWKGASWPNSSTVRIALAYDASPDPTSIYRYQFKVTAHRGVSVDSGEAVGTLALVNRTRSPFGSGWWLAGFEQLILDASGAPAMWVGGDGSVRRYTKLNDTAWVAASLERPDTLLREGNGFKRKSSAAVEVVFDSLGRHTRSRNRVKRETTFAYDAGGRLQSLSVSRADTIIPPNCVVLSDGSGVFCTAPVMGQLTWFFSYGPSGLLRSVASPGVGGNRTTLVTAEGTRIKSITDPDTTTVTFVYPNSSSSRISSRIDRRGFTTNYAFDAAGKLIYSKLEPGVGDTIVRRMRPVESLGLPDSLGGGAVDTAKAYTWLDGPRTDPGIADTTLFFLDSRGAPRRIVDALGNQTFLDRGDPRFAELVTRLQVANGLVTTVQHDARGNDSLISVLNPYGGDSSAVTQYVWDGKFDFIKQITLPNGEVTSFGYDSVGNRIYQQAGSDSARRVRFTYITGTDLLATIKQPLNAVPDSMLYDRLGNLTRAVTPLGFDRLISSDSIGRIIMSRNQVAFSRPANSRLYRNDSAVYDIVGRVRHTKTFGTSVDTTVLRKIVVSTNYDAEGNIVSITRSNSPDDSQIGPMTTQWQYDAANRAIAEIAPDNMRDSSFYDAAGNVIRIRTRRVDPADATKHLNILLVYDALNRLVQRIIPPTHFSADSSRGIPYSDAARHDTSTHAYPMYSNDGSGGFLIRGDTVRFVYDAMGRIATASNFDAHVTRNYFPNGALQSETLQLRAVKDSTYPHTYTIGYAYDLDGRRRQLNHPLALAPSPTQATTTYSYDPDVGELASVQDPLGNQFRFHYNFREDLDTLFLPGSTRVLKYDDNSRLQADTVLNAFATGGKLRAATLIYNEGDRLTLEANGTSPFDTLTAGYNTLGYVVLGKSNSQGTAQNGNSASSFTSDSVTYDALGNIDTRRSIVNYNTSGYSDTQNDTLTNFYRSGVGRLESAIYGEASLQFSYDSAGSETFRTGTYPDHLSQEDRASYYDAEGRLRAADSRTVHNYAAIMPYEVLVFEDYRYDALGRRVLVRSRRYCINDPNELAGECNISKVRRTVWDGDQELYEIQMPGSDSSAYLETDVALDSLPLDRSHPILIDPNPYFGRVSYTHGAGIDEPLGIIRMNYGDRFDNSGSQQDRGYRSDSAFSLIPVWNAQGQPQVGTFADGKQTRCRLISGLQRCVVITWPGTWFAYTRPRFRTAFWHGTILEDKQDHAGTHYRRNRYYDPQSGRFTQEDPIGLAGGMNMYGFAGGNPVNFSDPFGLCPPIEDCLQQIANWGAQQGGPVGTAVLNTAAGLNAINDFNLVTAAFDAGFEIGSGHVGRGLAMAALTIGGGEVGRGLSGASSGLRALFLESGGLAEETLIGIRATLRENGFVMRLSENKKGYLFTNGTGEEVRVMRGAKGWYMRVKNVGNNYLDVLANPASDVTTHLPIINR